MKFKQSQLLATAIRYFLEIFKDPDKRDAATLIRTTLKVSFLAPTLKAVSPREGGAISLSTARHIGLVTADGRFVADEEIPQGIPFGIDKQRLNMANFLLHENYTEVQKLLIDSVAFWVGLKIQQTKPYNLLQANGYNLDVDIAQLMAKLLNANLRESFLGFIIDHIQFDGDALTPHSIEAIEAELAVIEAAVENEEGIEIPEEQLTAPVPQAEPQKLSDEIISKFQRQWLSVLTVDDSQLEQAELKEHLAHLELVNIKQKIYEITFDGGWDVGRQLNPCWIKTGPGFFDYVNIPNRVSKLLHIIDKALTKPVNSATYFQTALESCDLIITNFNATYWSSKQSKAFFANLKQRVDLRSEQQAVKLDKQS